MQLQHTANNPDSRAQDSLALSSEMKLTRGREIKRVMKIGRKAVRPHVIVLAVAGTSRFAVVASRKYGPAVDRNCFKRRIREHFRQHCRETGLDIVVIARKASTHASYAQICESIDICLERLRKQISCAP